MIYFNKFFKFPGPKDLGMSNSNSSMPSRLFPNNNTELSWEDYYERLAKEYPVKFFFASTVPQFFLNIWWKISRPFKDARYWFISHFVPSRRIHWLDLRQPKSSPDAYRYGWCDVDTRMVYALMNLLVLFVEKEVPGKYYIPSEAEAALDDGSDGAKQQLCLYKEFMTIYNWWKFERPKELAHYNETLSAWSSAKKEGAPHKNSLWKELNAIEHQNDLKLEDMLIRLIKIRHVLWT